MNLSNSLVLAAAAVSVTAIAQDATAVVTDVAGKGGFTASATLGQLVEFQLTGLLVVFTVLGGLTLMCVLLAWIIKTVAPDQYHCKKKAAPAAPPAKLAPVTAPAVTAHAAAPASVHPGLTDEELVAILAVAATEAVGHAVAVVKFRHMGSMDWTWSVQGRVGQHTSHKL